jgi:hypothetical protein
LKLSDFNNKNGSSKKFLDNFLNRLENVEAKKGIVKDGEELELTDSEMERIFAKLRESRAKERYGPCPGGEYGYEDVDDEITDFEIDFYMQRALRPTPEQRYQNIKKRGYYRGHEKRCNNSMDGVCVPKCRFYPEYGRIEDEEVIADYENWKKERDATTRDEKRAERARKTNRVFTYDPDTPNDGTNSNKNIAIIIQRLIDEQIRNRRTHNNGNEYPR